MLVSVLALVLAGMLPPASRLAPELAGVLASVLADSQTPEIAGILAFVLVDSHTAVLAQLLRFLLPFVSVESVFASPLVFVELVAAVVLLSAAVVAPVRDAASLLSLSDGASAPVLGRLALHILLPAANRVP